MTEMKPSHAGALLRHYLSANVAAFLWGAPGVGKSSLVRQTAAAEGLALVDVRAILLDPVDLRGVPFVRDGRACWAAPDFLPREDRDGAEGLLLLDELNAAPPATMNACLGLVLERRLGDYRLPDGWRIVAAGNRREDRASINRMPAPLANRFAHVDVAPDVDDWSRWALGAGVRPELVAFVRYRPELLHKFDAGGGEPREFPSPRAWEFVSRAMDTSPPAEVELAAYAGIVGEGPAAELIGFLRVWRQLPSPDAILLDPHGAEVPSDPATLYALSGALARKATAGNMGSIAAYTERMPDEFGVVLMRDAIARDSSLQATAGFTTWATTRGDVLL